MHIHNCVKCSGICLELNLRTVTWLASTRPCLSVGKRVSEKFMAQT